MKKILYITRKELCKAMDVDEIVIQKEQKLAIPSVPVTYAPLVQNLLTCFKDMGVHIDNINQYVPDNQKILAIKTLRGFATVGMGLAEAKFAIEHLPEYFARMNNINNFPKLIFEAGMWGFEC